MAKILSWNVNGLRAVLSKGGLSPLDTEKPDVLCLQEIRAREDQVGQVHVGLPHQYFAATVKPGYSGTAILSRLPGDFLAGGYRRQDVR